ncbi:hypothetical protein ERJ75_000927700 [Trypanosoma vivax]|nr:hypothetical protein TRVL_01142 [Trypanosoma vivax]KAH8612057.1 hypothetical protein ERJ75_000927700 [Trypanosoma vivax]
MVMSGHACSSGSTAALPNPIEYPIVFAKEGVPAIGLFTSLQWLLPVFQLAGWLPKGICESSVEGDAMHGESLGQKNITTAGERNVERTRRLLSIFECFFTQDSRVVPNGALLHTVQSFRIPTPHGPRVITRALVESPRKYFCLLQPDRGGGHFLSRYEDEQLLGRCSYIELDRLRFAWVAVRELVSESKTVNQTDGSLTGLSLRDIRKNNCLSNDSVQENDGKEKSKAVTHSTAATVCDAPVPKRARPHCNVIAGPTPGERLAREAQIGRRYMSDLLRDECAARWPYTPVEKSVVFTFEERHAEIAGGRPGRKGPRMYLAAVELPLLKKKNSGPSEFKATTWYATKRDAENAAAEVALRALRTTK